MNASLIARLVGRPGGPSTLAVIFAISALPVVLLEVPGFDTLLTTQERDAPRMSVLAPAVLAASIGAVLAAALVAGFIGARMVRRHAIIGALVTIAVAWTTAIITLPVWPALFGLHYATASICIDGCLLAISGPTTGITAFAQGWWLSWAVAPFTLGVLVVGVGIWTWLVRHFAVDEGSTAVPQSLLDTRLQLTALTITASSVIVVMVSFGSIAVGFAALPMLLLIGASRSLRGRAARVVACFAIGWAALGFVNTIVRLASGSI